MRTKAKFEKVSYQQYSPTATGKRTAISRFRIGQPLKAQATIFYAPTEIAIGPNCTVTVATGIRALMPDDWCLMIYPRSGLGFKYRLKLDNTVGIIDADYCNSDNEGHIFVRMTNESAKPLIIAQGSAFAQGVFTRYMLTEDDDATAERNGGLGSTSR